MLPSRHRLRASEDFTATLRSRRGLRSGSATVVIHTTMTGTRAGCPPRVGFVVSKGVGNAVTRNLVKRRLRALLAQRISVLPAGGDFVVRANPAAAQASYAQLGADVDRVLNKLLPRLAAVDASGDSGQVS
ncbi:ribonuclease P protein component [Kribbia dieselivorans]|uniref:ribonuclease P protein component n=1 Tax=Kribbia dieselivorans TaxID=331526 RepID=UPI00083975BA|nr:ribonuclease P protein component [Kribbia dieselivorans]